MPVKAETVAIGVAATLIVTGSGSIQDPTPVTIINKGVGTVYIGGPDVDAADGYPIETDEAFNISLLQGDVLYGISALATEVKMIRARQ